MKTIFISHQGSKLACIKFGSGEKSLLCFHGYGLDKNSFLPFEEKFGAEYTLYSFDSFAHGKSLYGKADNALELSEWRTFMEVFLAQENIDKFSILAFSMGGKIALCTLEMFTNRIQKMVLIAPDGIKTNFWYNAATYPGILSNAFRYTVFHPAIYFGLIEVLKFFRAADKSLLKFAENEMNTATKRSRVYFAWMIYSHFRPNLDNIIKISTEYEIPFVFYTAKYDRIIPTKAIVAFAQKIRFAEHYDFDCGHTNLMKFVSKFQK